MESRDPGCGSAHARSCQSHGDPAPAPGWDFQQGQGCKTAGKNPFSPQATQMRREAGREGREGAQGAGFSISRAVWLLLLHLCFALLSGDGHSRNAKELRSLSTVLFTSHAQGRSWASLPFPPLPTLAQFFDKYCLPSFLLFPPPSTSGLNRARFKLSKVLKLG